MALLPTMKLFVIRASDWLTSEIPPPTPTLMELLLITLAETVGVPAAQRLMPPPSLSERFPLITLFSTCAVPAPETRMPLQADFLALEDHDGAPFVRDTTGIRTRRASASGCCWWR
jgi:hypothetical protein